MRCSPHVSRERGPPLSQHPRQAVTVDKAEQRDVYGCPVYKTTQRGPTYVFTANLRSKAAPTKWVLAGVGMIMDVIGT